MAWSFKASNCNGFQPSLYSAPKQCKVTKPLGISSSKGLILYLLYSIKEYIYHTRFVLIIFICRHVCINRLIIFSSVKWRRATRHGASSTNGFRYFTPTQRHLAPIPSNTLQSHNPQRLGVCKVRSKHSYKASYNHSNTLQSHNPQRLGACKVTGYKIKLQKRLTSYKVHVIVNAYPQDTSYTVNQARIERHTIHVT